MFARRVLGIAAVALVASASIAMADPRPFTFVYDTYPHGPQGFEFEQFVTWEHGEDQDLFEFREEVEFGLAENFDVGIYLPIWTLTDTDDDTDVEFKAVAVETIFYVTNPVEDFIGIGLYNEVAAGQGEVEFEQKLLLHKDIGNWTLAYNLVAETELEHLWGDDEDAEVEGVLEHVFGVSYALGQHWRVGGEAEIASEYENWSHYEGTTSYGGPNFSYQSERWYITTTAMFQLEDEEGEPDFVVRSILGVEFGD
jgi:hypothetical protein